MLWANDGKAELKFVCGNAVAIALMWLVGFTEAATSWALIAVGIWSGVGEGIKRGRLQRTREEYQRIMAE
jgi:hypothetical protein